MNHSRNKANCHISKSIVLYIYRWLCLCSQSPWHESHWSDVAIRFGVPSVVSKDNSRLSLSTLTLSCQRPSLRPCHRFVSIPVSTGRTVLCDSRLIIVDCQDRFPQIFFDSNSYNSISGWETAFLYLRQSDCPYDISVKLFGYGVSVRYDFQSTHTHDRHCIAHKHPRWHTTDVNHQHPSRRRNAYWTVTCKQIYDSYTSIINIPFATCVLLRWTDKTRCNQFTDTQLSATGDCRGTDPYIQNYE